MDEPFLAFSKVIVNYINNKFLAEKYKANMKKLFSVIENVVSSMSLSFLNGRISLSAEDLLNKFKDSDPIINFREQLSSFIAKIPKKKIVIIVDELDRCRPDYAMKTLECIKHFFDIEGLFIIIPTNTQALNNCVKSLYGFDNNKENSTENYFQKFFNDKRTIKKPTEEDYLHIVKQYLTKTRLQEALDKKLLSENEKYYNSFQNLQRYFAMYSYKARLTVRELKDFSIELGRMCNNFYEPIRVQWLSCVMAYKNYSSKNYDFRYPLEQEHCFYKEHYTSTTHKNGKSTLLTIPIYTTHLSSVKINSYIHDDDGNYINSRIITSFINKYKKLPNGYEKYEDIMKFFNDLATEITDVKSYYANCTQIMETLQTIEEKVFAQKQAIEKYQNKYGSDDNDKNRESNYQNIVDFPEILYSTT